MPAQPSVIEQLQIVAATLVCLGLVTMIVQRNLLQFFIGGQILFQGICLASATYIHLQQPAEGEVWLMLILGMAVLHALWGVALATAARFRDGAADFHQLFSADDTAAKLPTPSDGKS